MNPYKPSPRDITRADETPHCFCGLLGTHGGRKLDQMGAGLNAKDKAFVQSNGRWVTVYSCDRHVLELAERGAMDIQAIVKPKCPRKTVPQTQDKLFEIPSDEPPMA